VSLSIGATGMHIELDLIIENLKEIQGVKKVTLAGTGGV